MNQYSYETRTHIVPVPNDIKAFVLWDSLKTGWWVDGPFRIAAMMVRTEELKWPAVETKIDHGVNEKGRPIRSTAILPAAMFAVAQQENDGWEFNPVAFILLPDDLGQWMNEGGSIVLEGDRIALTEEAAKKMCDERNAKRKATAP